MTAPLFVKVDKYNDINHSIEGVRTKISEAKAILARISELKNREDNEVASWHDDLESVEQRISQLQETLPKPEK